ncbi:unnamed protein product, partial [Brassica oleracea]
MATSSLLIVLLSSFLSVTSGYSLSTRDAVCSVFFFLFRKYDDESYSRASSEKVPSMVDVKDLKARNLQALVVVNKASRGWNFIKIRKHNSNKVGSLDVLTFVGIIILAVIVTGVIIAFLYNLYHVHKTKNTQSIGGQGKLI